MLNAVSLIMLSAAWALTEEAFSQVTLDIWLLFHMHALFDIVSKMQQDVILLSGETNDKLALQMLLLCVLLATLNLGLEFQWAAMPLLD